MWNRFNIARHSRRAPDSQAAYRCWMVVCYFTMTRKIRLQKFSNLNLGVIWTSNHNDLECNNHLIQNKMPQAVMNPWQSSNTNKKLKAFSDKCNYEYNYISIATLTFNTNWFVIPSLLIQFKSACRIIWTHVRELMFVKDLACLFLLIL